VTLPNEKTLYVLAAAVHWVQRGEEYGVETLVMDAQPSSLVIYAAEKAGQDDLLDLNTVSAEQLKSLLDIGDAYSEKIIKGRPYQRKDELVQKKILPRATCESIKHKIVAKQKCASSRSLRRDSGWRRRCRH
jgi:DNA uptake protein ComE-like DNA-binding protein